MTTRLILILAFLEGCTVILIELLGGKFLSAMFGSSLIVWTSTIGVTMFSLMIGYFIGGRLSNRKNSLLIVYSLFVAAALWVLFLPELTHYFIKENISKGLYLGSFLASLFSLSLPLIILGSVPPILIQNVSLQNILTGKSSGLVFSLSTVGGIVASMGFGFFIIEDFGITIPLKVWSIIMVLYSLIAFNKLFKNKLIPFSFVVFCVFFTMIKLKENTPSKVQLHLSESLQGQLRVTQHVLKNQKVIRTMQINGVRQTFENVTGSFYNNGESFSDWSYPHILSSICSSKPENSNALLLGFGAGSMGRELVKLGFNVDAVEIDRRLPEIARDYFFYDFSTTNLFIDDARHFVKKSTKQYDIVIFDLLTGEAQPSHVITKEGLNDLKSALAPDALVLFNFQSNKNEPKQPVYAILKTLIDSGFDVRMGDFDGGTANDYSFVASLSPINDAELFAFNRLNTCCSFAKKTIQFTPNSFKQKKELDPIKYQNATALIDDLPRLDYLNRETMRLCREDMMNGFGAFLIENGEALYK